MTPCSAGLLLRLRQVASTRSLPGRDILVVGSAQLVQTLAQHQLEFKLEGGTEGCTSFRWPSTRHGSRLTV